VLSGLLIKAEAGMVSIASFDYEISARLRIPADVSEEGTILVSGRLLADISRSLPSAPVDVSTDGLSAITPNCPPYRKLAVLLTERPSRKQSAR
jgi:DNA polymerase-3 subunit beta